VKPEGFADVDPGDPFCRQWWLRHEPVEGTGTTVHVTAWAAGAGWAGVEGVMLQQEML